MKVHISDLVPRMIRAGMKVSQCRYRVIAAGIDHKNRVISIATNRPYLRNRGHHAEERIMFSSPRSLRKIMIIRVSARGEMLKIDPCELCQELARRKGIKIVTAL